jgi:hypothetical protein
MIGHCYSLVVVRQDSWLITKDTSNGRARFGSTVPSGRYNPFIATGTITQLAWIVAGTAGALVLVLALYMALLFIAHDFNPDFLGIDACLDHGGRWNDDRRVCDSAR